MVEIVTVEEIKMSSKEIEYGKSIAEQLKEIDDALTSLCLPFNEIGRKD